MEIKPVIYSIFVVVVGLTIYWHLYTGGWLTNPYYRLGDADIINLLLAILEPVMVLVVVAFWLKRGPVLYRTLFVTFLLQILIGLCFGLVFLIFVLTWKPRLM